MRPTQPSQWSVCTLSGRRGLVYIYITSPPPSPPGPTQQVIHRLRQSDRSPGPLQIQRRRASRSRPMMTAPSSRTEGGLQQLSATISNGRRHRNRTTKDSHATVT